MTFRRSRNRMIGLSWTTNVLEVSLTILTNNRLYLKDHFNIILLLFAAENQDLKANLADLARIRHDLEVEVRRLEAERNELANALSESEAVSLNL